jgi:hypothetical protein
MPFFGVEIEFLEFDALTFQKTLIRAAENQMKQAAKAFARAALPRIPIRTGFVRGSWDNLTDLLGLGRLGGAQEIRLLKRRLKGMTTIEVGKALKIIKRIQKIKAGETKAVGMRKPPPIIRELKRARNLGAKLGFGKFVEKRGETLHVAGSPEYYRDEGYHVLKSRETGRAFGTPENEIFQITSNGISFTFNSSISYFRINEFFSGHAPTAPWGSLAAGRAAMLEYLRTYGIKRLPRVSEFFVRTNIAMSEQGRSFRKLSTTTLTGVYRETGEE